MNVTQKDETNNRNEGACLKNIFECSKENSFHSLTPKGDLLRLMSCPKLLRREAKSRPDPRGFLKLLRQWQELGYPEIVSLRQHEVLQDTNTIHQ